MTFSYCITHVSHPVNPYSNRGVAREPCFPEPFETIQGANKRLCRMIKQEYEILMLCLAANYSDDVKQRFWLDLDAYISDYVDRVTKDVEISDDKSVVIELEEISDHEYEELQCFYENAEADDITSDSIEEYIEKNMSICGHILMDLFEKAEVTVTYRISHVETEK